MSSESQACNEAPAPLPVYRAILLALDSSDHANQATQEAIALAAGRPATITGSHVYAATMHDYRFRQMEGGLPAQFREEQELERQRDVHDDLISRGLSIITDSYLDQAERACLAQGLTFRRRSLEGKNYRELTRETNSGHYDLLVMGALGLGAISGSRIGSVAQRVARRTTIDTLVIKEPGRPLSDGPLVAAIDGSPKSYAGLRTALALANRWQRPLHVIAAFDPYYHYVAFNRIAGVLSEEAGKVFRFEQQEQLHEEIIDSGLARIYQGHLEIAQTIADDYAIPIETRLLDGKPHDAIERYLEQVGASLLVVGKTGIHADADLDIGGNSELLLQNCRCAILLSQSEYTPEVERLAEVTTSWSHEAERRMERVPSFVRSMARMAILRYAQEQGHTVITERLVDEATARLMPAHAEQAMGEIVEAYDRGELGRLSAAPMALAWGNAADTLLRSIVDSSLRGNLQRRAEKRARQQGASEVTADHLRPFLDNPPGEAEPLHWQAAALARLARVPEGFMREASRERIVAYADRVAATEVTLSIAEAALAEARGAMAEAVDSEPEGNQGGCPFAAQRSAPPSQTPVSEANDSKVTPSPPWSEEAEAMLERVPAGFCRVMTRRAAETIASQGGMRTIEPPFIEQVMATFKAGSSHASETLPWQEVARERIARAPDMVRGMLVQEIEAWSRRQQLTEVSGEAVDAVKQQWLQRGIFHLDPDDPRNGP